MVLPHNEVFPILQPNLQFKDTQEDIISNLVATAWRLRRSGQQYQQVLVVLEREEERAELLRGVPEVQEATVVDRLAQAPVRPSTYTKSWLTVDTQGEKEKKGFLTKTLNR